MYHISFIYSSIEGNLDCFQVLTITNNAAMNIVEQMSLWYNWASFGYMYNSDIAGLEVGSFLIFWSTTILDSRVSVKVCTPTSSGGVFLFLHILSNISCQQYFWSYFSVTLICVSLMAKDVEQFFKCLSAIWDSSVKILCLGH